MWIQPKQLTADYCHHLQNLAIITAVSDEYVIQTHSGFGPLHYDLMLQRGNALSTWQLLQSPLELAEGKAIIAKRLKDHRLTYLTYEGDVSGGRGCVKILDKGTYQLTAADETLWKFQLHGRLLDGRFELRRLGESSDEWHFLRLRDI